MARIKLRGKIYDLDEPLFGADAIAEVRNQSARQVYHAAAEDRFAHRKDGRIIVSTPREVLEPLLGPAGIDRLTIPEAAA
jgi:hypothetical protein